MSSPWTQRLQKWRGEPIDNDLSGYEATLADIESYGKGLSSKSDDELKQLAPQLTGTVEYYALVREVAQRVLGMRPFDVQIIAALALHQNKLIEMQTGEGKTLVAVLPASLNAVSKRGVHILTFNDYLARRDAAWMGPVYEFLGLSVGTIQEGMTPEARRRAYAQDITYATAKEAGFDFLRMHLARDRDHIVHRPFHFAIIDEADSILIDEARSPLVVAGDRIFSDTSPYHIADMVRHLEKNRDWESDQYDRNVTLTDEGIERVERELQCGDLHAEKNYLLLTEVNQALHARALFSRDIDYLVRDNRIELIDEFTGRVVEDRRWPDGLQSAIEAKEGVPIRPGGRVLGSITLQHFLRHYPRLAGMTATAQTSAEELEHFYGLRVVPVPSNKPCIREDLSGLVFANKASKEKALVEEITQIHRTGRPILVGTSSVQESEMLAEQLHKSGIECEVLNAKNDEAEAAIIARAGAVGAVTISTNMAGRGTDIKLGGPDESDRAKVVESGGLYVIGTNRHESRRIDNQLRGRAGRQGDPGTSQFFTSLEDDLMVRYRIDQLVPENSIPELHNQNTPIGNRHVLDEVDRLQRIVEGQNYEIRKMLALYAVPVEEQRRRVQEWRMAILLGEEPLELCSERVPERYQEVIRSVGKEAAETAERAITLHYIDECWAEHLSFITQLREGIHLEGLGKKDPLTEFYKKIANAFIKIEENIDSRVLATFESAKITREGVDLASNGLEAPASTWTYLVNDRGLTQMQQMLYGVGNTAIVATAIVTNWPLLAISSAWYWFKRMKKGR